jgi:hypothetical protein
MSIPTANEWLEFPNHHPIAHPCQFLVLYSDLAAKTQAERLGAKLSAKFSDEIEFCFSWWVFSVLRDPRLLHLAVEEAAAADIILFSLGRSRNLTVEVAAFNERWLKLRHGNEGLLAYMFEDETEEAEEEPVAYSSSLADYFRELAKKSQMDFIAADQAAPPADTARENSSRRWMTNLITQLHL